MYRSVFRLVVTLPLRKWQQQVIWICIKREIMATILETIAEATKIRVEESKRTIDAANMRRMAEEMDANTGYPFLQALAKPGMSFICECKKASPSKGLIAPDFPYLDIAKDYEKAGASCISVLTEPKWFLGCNEYLKEITQAVSIPCIRKDFTVDEYMIHEAKTLGAAAVLLICSILSKEQLSEYLEIAHGLGLSAIVETHDEAEMQMAIDAKSKIVGVNNRNLKDFTVDVSNSQRLRDMAPKDMIFVAESGIKTREDVAGLEKSGVDAVLIGETLMKADDKKAMLDYLKGIENV